jgi:23S rRNA (adenine-N6)-dimethyltransferase
VILETSRKNERYTTHGVDDGRGEWSNRRRKRRCELSQNFLKDKRVARRIVEGAGAGKDDLVVELGAGGGMLTRQPARVAQEVVAVEYDSNWAKHLKERSSGDVHVRVVHEDALSVKHPREPFRVVANVPFCITTSILHRLLDDPTAPSAVVHVLVQKQVALKHARSTPPP